MLVVSGEYSLVVSGVSGWWCYWLVVLLVSGVSG